jgi:hypothetical protein
MNTVQTNKCAQAVTYMTCIREGYGSDLDRSNNYPEVSKGFPQSFQATVTPFQNLSNSFSLILSFDTV